MYARPLGFPAGILLIAVFSCLPALSGEQKKPPQVQANPNAPMLDFSTVLGGKRGTKVLINLPGSNLAGSIGLVVGTWENGPHTSIELKEGELFRISIPADIPLGLYPLRVATKRGMSNVRLFTVDDLPEIAKDASNDKKTPQKLEPPCVVTGRLNKEGADYYQITVAAGQRLSFDVLGRRLGGPIDPELTIYHAKSGAEVAYQNDTPGCQSDPRLTHTFKEAGDYIIEIKDSLRHGGAEYGYRLRVGDFPCAAAPLPLAIKRGAKTLVRFTGPNVDGVVPVEVDAPMDPAITTLWVTPRGKNSLAGWPVLLGLSDHDETVEQEPNDDRAKANRLPVPGGVTGTLSPVEDRDCFVFPAKKGQKLLIEAQTLEFNSPALVDLVIRDAKGKELAKSNPAAPVPADQRIEFNPPADGDYFLEVQQRNFGGGPSEVYRVTVIPNNGTFDLSIPLDRWDAARGESVALPVVVNRRGYTGPIDLQVLGPNGVTGSVTVPADQTSISLEVKIAADTPRGAYVFAVQGKAVVDGIEVRLLADVGAAVRRSLNDLPVAPRMLNTQIGLAVR